MCCVALFLKLKGMLDSQGEPVRNAVLILGSETLAC